MKLRKWISVALSLTVMASMAACGGAPAASSGGQTPPSGGTSSQSQPVQTDKPFELKQMLVLYNQAPDPNGEFWKDMQATYNVNLTIEWVPESTYNDKIALSLATNSIPDVVQITSLTDPSVVKAMEAGQFMDLTPQLDFKKYQHLGKINSAAWMNSKYQGKNYVFPRSRGQYNDSFYIREDLLKKYNLKKPETIDELTEYFRAIKAESGMIPIPMEVGQPNNSITGFVYEAFGPGNVRPVFTDDGSGIVNQALTDAYAKTVEYLKMLYDEGLLATEFPLYKTEKNQDMFLAGKGGCRMQNAWHRYRLETELQKVVPDAKLIPLFGISGEGGQSVCYDKGFFGGYALNASLSEERRDWIFDFFNKTADPDKYWYFKYGLEGSYYTVEDGFPKLTKLGEKEVTNSFYGPYVLATDLYDKVNSPLAPSAFNRETQEMVKDVDTFSKKIDGAPFRLFEIIYSQTWAQYWSMNQKDFEAYVADTITGKHSIEEFREYQKKILADPQVQAAGKEFKQSYDEFGLANWKPTT